MASNTKTFRFFDLPAELRNMIYERVFEGSTTQAQHRTFSPVGSTIYFNFKAGPSTNTVRGLPPQLLTNRAFYTEAVEIFWAQTA